MYHVLVWTDRTVHALNSSAERRIEYQNCVSRDLSRYSETSYSLAMLPAY